jgi:hypothetical protein
MLLDLFSASFFASFAPGRPCSAGQPQGRVLGRSDSWLLLVAAARGPGPSGTAALSSGRAGARSGLRARWHWTPAEAIFKRLDFRRLCDLRLLLEDNYNQTNITAEAQSTRRTNERRRLLLREQGTF